MMLGIPKFRKESHPERVKDNEDKIFRTFWTGRKFSILFLIFRHPFIIISVTASSEGMYL